MKTNIIKLREVDSTNRYLHDYQPADEEMTVVTALHQTAGRGQGTNKWEDKAGDNLLFSMLVHPHWLPVGRQFLFSEAHALALKEALDHYCDDILIKWPNDIYWHDHKLSGTLIETSVDSKGMKSIIAGTGINVNQREFHIDAPNPVSLYQITGHETSLDELLLAILTAFNKYYEQLHNGAYGDIAALYYQSLYRTGGFYPYRDEQGEFEASLFEVEDDGHLLLRDREGRVRRYAFKEVQYII